MYRRGLELIARVWSLLAVGNRRAWRVLENTYVLVQGLPNGRATFLDLVACRAAIDLANRIDELNKEVRERRHLAYPLAKLVRPRE